VESLLAADASSSALLEAPMREAAAILASQQSQSQHQLAPGLELGPYLIEARLGAGGMGEVYRAKDKRLRRTVALKVLPPHLAGTVGPQQRLEREAEAISSLNHPHICTLYDIGRQDEIDYLVMEFLEGETLAERLKRGALPLSELLEFAIQIASALDAAHSKGIIHRDIS
jgi:serine/threonine protein kinase